MHPIMLAHAFAGSALATLIAHEASQRPSDIAIVIGGRGPGPLDHFPIDAPSVLVKDDFTSRVELEIADAKRRQALRVAAASAAAAPRIEAAQAKRDRRNAKRARDASAG